MKTITLVPKVYGQYRNRLLTTLQSEIETIISELDLSSVILDVDKREHVFLSVEGPDSEFVINLLSQEYGKAPASHEILPERVYSGQLTDVGKVGYGIYVDVGLSESKIDALLPLHRLREQMGMEGVPLRRLARSLVLVDYLPVEIQVSEVNFENEQIGAEFSQSFLERYNEWLTDDHERLLVFGANQEMLEATLEKAGHTDDIYKIEKLGIFEFALQCKRSTRASGILAAIGPRLRGVPMHLFIPREIQAAKHGAKA
ncbi:MAG: DUF2110 family protein [Candidatus Thorarchaeota archaeon]